MEVRKILEKMGYTNLLGSDWYKYVKVWLEWYEGKTAFHKYIVYNGQSNISCTRKTLGMAKKVAEDKADLLLNEKVGIFVSPTVAAAEGEVQANPVQEYVDKVLKANNFWVRGNQLVELANALGTGAFVEYLEDKDVCIDYIPATCIWPLSWKNGNITECAFASSFTLGKGKPKTYIQRHVIENGQYTIYNDLFSCDGKPEELPEGLLPVFNTGSKTPLFQIITPNVVNNIDIINPMGVSIYANSVDVLEDVDLVFDSYFNEFKLGKKRIFVDDTVVKTDIKDGKLIPIFDPNDTVFYGIPGKQGGNTKAIEESNMDLRVEAHKTALQDSLDILSDKCGFGKGYYKFDTDDVQTATAVISQNSKLFRKIKKDEIILNAALENMTRAVLFLGGMNTEVDISVSFDDSIIEDTNAIANRAMLELQEDIIDAVVYMMRVYGMTEEAAIAFVKKIAERKAPAPTPPPDPNANPFGGEEDVITE